MTPILSVRDLSVEFRTPDGSLRAVDGACFDIAPGETLALVGESGCGKTTAALALLGLLPRSATVTGGEIRLGGWDLRRASKRELRRLRGSEVAMVFQDPATSLHPLFPVGRQVTEAVRVHHPALSRAAAADRAVELLQLVGIPAPRARLRDFPHQWSGGMRQRAMIAMAIANDPRLLVADEPTTALDVTVQAQVLDVLRSAQANTGAGLLLITHDLGVVAEMADRVAVMYAGRIVESGTADDVFHTPRHPYTLGLMANVPRPDVDLRRLSPIPGHPPSLLDVPPGCAFHPRCRLQRGRARCRTDVPALLPAGGPGQSSACHFSQEMDAEAAAVAAELGADLTGGRS